MFLVTYIKKHNNTYTALKRSLAKPLLLQFPSNNPNLKKSEC